MHWQQVRRESSVFPTGDEDDTALPLSLVMKLFRKNFTVSAYSRACPVVGVVGVAFCSSARAAENSPVRVVSTPQHCEIVSVATRFHFTIYCRNR